MKRNGGRNPIFTGLAWILLVMILTLVFGGRRLF